MDDRELRELARKRPLRTREIHPFNAFYGHDSILKRYAGYPEHVSLKAAVEHGVTMDDLVSDLDRQLRLPTYLSCGNRRAEFVARELGVRTTPIGPLIRYAEALHPPRGTDAIRRLLVMPAHSAHTVSAEFDVDEFLAGISNYAVRFDEVVVCLYWKDVLLGRADEYRRRGLICVTAGHMYDSRFLVRLLELLRGASALFTNEVGTHVPYAVLLGRPVWILRQQVHQRVAAGTPRDQVAAVERRRKRPSELVSVCERLFADPRLELTAEQVRFVEDLAGVAYVRSPSELGAILHEAEKRYNATVSRRRRALHRTMVAARALRSRLRLS